MDRQASTYILANRRHGTLYTGVTSNLVRRVWEHKNDFVEGFTRRYQIHSLVYYEMHSTIYEAISREKQIKAGSRKTKIVLIEAFNPSWTDLYPGLLSND